MRLLHKREDGSLELTPDLPDDMHPYAILSHTWGADSDEVTLADIQTGQYKDKKGYEKIRFCSEQAVKDGIHHFWVDTCCIDKPNHSELTEAITSMYRWYENAQKCYVYLTDVSHTQSIAYQPPDHTDFSDFRNCRWFKRGWTLQELLAPKIVEFYDEEGVLIGTKDTLAELIHDITKIPLAAIRGSPLSVFSIVERLSWARNRQTKKEEDMAYCLLGIFDVYMPLLYGEKNNAMRRLRKMISERLEDHPPSALRKCARIEADCIGLSLNSAPAINEIDFVGRKDELRVMHEILQPDVLNDEQKRVILGGLGGIGKTQLAIAYARLYKDEYSSVLWCNATTAQTLHASLRTIFRNSNSSQDLSKLDDAQILAQFQDWMSRRNRKEWLLIFDNYDEPEAFDIDLVCPKGHRGFVIITTRLPDLFQGRQMRLQPLKNSSEALEILQRRSGRIDVHEGEVTDPIPSPLFEHSHACAHRSQVHDILDMWIA